ncbi:hypothetical protein BaRGS_00037130 [Batillaria attramentaria]|uniref:G-protein coupled receptors family 1 profile domain-containing protein n=1 Tax=Batillaria attramentaria TaxID=370345 RepID=A0ABD0J9X8_9CAEN
MNSTAGYVRSISSNGTTSDPDQLWKDRIYMMWAVWSPMILTFGIAGNSMTVMIMSHLKLRSTSLLYLLALAVTDISNLCFSLFPRWMKEVFDVSFRRQGPVACILEKWVGYSLGLLSAHLLAALTVTRAIAAVHPHSVKHMCTQQRVHVTIIVIAIIDFAQHVYLPFAMNPYKCKFTEHFATTILPIKTYIDFAQYSLGPAVVIFLANILIARALLLSHRRSTFVTPGNQSAFAIHRENKRRRTTQLIIGLSLCFLVLTLPTTVLRFAEGRGKFGLSYGAFCFAYEFAKLWWYMNSAVNFYLYIGSSEQLRREAKKRFRGLWRKPLRMLDLRRSPSKSQSKTSSGGSLADNYSSGSSTLQPSAPLPGNDSEAGIRSLPAQIRISLSLVTRVGLHVHAGRPSDAPDSAAGAATPRQVSFIVPSPPASDMPAERTGALGGSTGTLLNVARTGVESMRAADTPHVHTGESNLVYPTKNSQPFQTLRMLKHSLHLMPQKHHLHANSQRHRRVQTLLCFAPVKVTLSST